MHQLTAIHGKAHGVYTMPATRTTVRYTFSSSSSFPRQAVGLVLFRQYDSSSKSNAHFRSCSEEKGCLFIQVSYSFLTMLASLFKLSRPILLNNSSKMFVRPRSDRRMLYQQLKNSSVTVIVETSSEAMFFGTGTVWDSSHIVTSRHLFLDNPKSIFVSDMKDVSQIDGRMFTAILVDAFPEIDIALLKLVDNEKIHINPVIRADVQEVFVGDEVFAIGRVLGGKLPKSYLGGVISGVDRNAETEMGVMIPGVLQTTVASMEGCSGSPLFTDSGYCVGICFGAICPSVAFAIPINMVHDAIAKI
ncbi:hypothetical protein R3W88_007379 [Solanum pinnatisectum]|uniref:Uncharacterized protein n=1 Tax=Solanum pinnatisectum TaxID=50273 RepID=A0AAV9M4X2_9SOLN|nr:hypothetical protein R3W88_007379 [Solanum pinnatisectum]